MLLFVGSLMTFGMLVVAQISRPSRFSTSVREITTTTTTRVRLALGLETGRLVPAAAQLALAIGVEVLLTARVVVAVVDLVARLVVVEEAASEAHVEAAEEGDLLEVERVKVLPQHPRQASRNQPVYALQPAPTLIPLFQYGEKAHVLRHEPHMLGAETHRLPSTVLFHFQPSDFQTFIASTVLLLRL